MYGIARAAPLSVKLAEPRLTPPPPGAGEEQTAFPNVHCSLPTVRCFHPSPFPLSTSHFPLFPLPYTHRP